MMLQRKLLPNWVEPENISHVDAGTTFGIAIQQDGTVVQWGLNLYGEILDGTWDTEENILGEGKLEDQEEESLTKKKRQKKSCDDQLVAEENWHQKGHSAAARKFLHSPPASPTLKLTVQALACGPHHVFAALQPPTDTPLLAWGLNTAPTGHRGILGIWACRQQDCFSCSKETCQEDGPVPAREARRPMPVRLPQAAMAEGRGTAAAAAAAAAVVAVAAGARHAAAALAGGRALAWGAAAQGELGILPFDEGVKFCCMPTMCRITNVENVAVGNNHTLFLTSNGLVHSCGSNKYGQLGQPDVSWEGTAVPGPVAGLPPPALCSGGVRGVAAGPLCSVALTRSGDVYFWGRSAALHNSRQQGGLKKDHDGDDSISQSHHDDSDNDDDYLSYFLEEADEEGEDIQAESDPILLTEEVCGVPESALGEVVGVRCDSRSIALETRGRRVYVLGREDGDLARLINCSTEDAKDI